MRSGDPLAVLAPQRVCWRVLSSVLAAALAQGVLPTPTRAATRPAASPAIIERISISPSPVGASVAIVTDGPVRYVTTSTPDERTVLVELWNTMASKRLEAGLIDSSGAITQVNVETIADADGSPRARLRLRLARPARSHLRTAGRETVLELERLVPARATALPKRTSPQLSPATASAPVPSLLPRTTDVATELMGLEISTLEDGPTITLLANGRLVPASVSMTTEPPPRLVLDFPQVSPTIPRVIPGDANTVLRVRVAVFSRAPLVTRVVIDLVRQVAYRVVQSDTGRELRIVFPHSQVPVAQTRTHRGRSRGQFGIPGDVEMGGVPIATWAMPTELPMLVAAASTEPASSSFHLGVNGAVASSQIFRVILKDGSALESYGEFASASDRVVFSLPLRSGRSEPSLHLISLPDGVVDWHQTTRYAESARATYYAATRGDADFEMLAAKVANTLRQIASIADPTQRLAVAVTVRRELKRWPADHFGYRKADIDQITELLDGVISELRVAAGVSEFDLSFEVSLAGPELVPLMPPPTPKDSIDAALKIVRLIDVPAERLSLMASIAATLKHGDSTLPQNWSRDTRRLVVRALDAERQVEAAYGRMSTAILERATSRAGRADVKGVEVLLADIQRRDSRLGRKRPDVIAALQSTIYARLDAARQLQLARDRWTLQVRSYRSYQTATKGSFGEFERSQTKLSAIKRFTGPPAPVLTELSDRWGRTRRALGEIEPPDELKPAHTLLIKAAELAQSAFRARFQAVASNNVQLAADASAAAAGAMMLFAQAQTQMKSAFEFPQLK